jgi:regulator of sigma E protease
LDFGTLIPNFGNAAFTIAAFVVALSVIVAIHEYGHYIVGRWSGIHAEVFSLGFGPVVYSRVDKRGTKWQLAALPFGGYVRFLGDSNAASGKDAGAIAGLSDAEKRHTMHGAPLWARAATVAAGPVFNFMLSIVVFAGFALWQGVATDRAVVGALSTVPFDGPTLEIGDQITSLDGKPVSSLDDLGAIAKTLPPTPEVTYTVIRAGETFQVAAPHPIPAIVGAVQPQSAGYDAGLQSGDLIQFVDAVPIYSFDQMRDIFGKSNGRPFELTVLRNGNPFKVTLSPRYGDAPTNDGGFEKRWLVGLNGGTLAFTPELREAGILESVHYAVLRVWQVITGTFSSLYHIITGDISRCALKGPVGMAQTASAAAWAGPADFVWMIAAMSTAIGLMNLFPIPVLDGGHLVFHAWEALTRRPPNEKVLGVLMTAGLIAILSLMVFALTNDFTC